MGDDQPRPGTAMFQATFSFVLQRSGRLGWSATPRAPGPRNWGQLVRAAAWACPVTMSATTPRMRGFMALSVGISKFKSQTSNGVLRETNVAPNQRKDFLFRVFRVFRGCPGFGWGYAALGVPWFCFLPTV